MSEAITPIAVRAREAAKHMTVCRSTFYQRVKNGDYPPARDNFGISVWLIEELNECLKAMPTTKASSHDAAGGMKRGYTPPAPRQSQSAIAGAQ